MSSTVGFTFDDIYEYFSSKGGKVVYTDIVTHFKYALTDPKSQGIFLLNLNLIMLNLID